MNKLCFAGAVMFYTSVVILISCGFLLIFAKLTPPVWIFIACPVLFFGGALLFSIGYEGVEFD